MSDSPLFDLHAPLPRADAEAAEQLLARFVEAGPFDGGVYQWTREQLAAFALAVAREVRRDHQAALDEAARSLQAMANQMANGLSAPAEQVYTRAIEHLTTETRYLRDVTAMFERLRFGPGGDLDAHLALQKVWALAFQDTRPPKDRIAEIVEVTSRALQADNAVAAAHDTQPLAVNAETMERVLRSCWVRLGWYHMMHHEWPHPLAGEVFGALDALFDFSEADTVPLPVERQLRIETMLAVGYQMLDEQPRSWERLIAYLTAVREIDDQLRAAAPTS